MISNDFVAKIFLKVLITVIIKLITTTNNNITQKEYSRCDKKLDKTFINDCLVTTIIYNLILRSVNFLFNKRICVLLIITHIQRVIVVVGLLIVETYSGG